MTYETWRVVLCMAGCMVACGGSEGGSGAPTCTTFAACGGDVVGTWKVASTCVTNTGDGNAALGGSCPNATSTYGIDVQGTASFAADGTYRNNVSIATDLHVTIPASCLTPTVTCAAVQTALGAALGSAQCTGDAASGCTCDAHDVAADAKSGRYTIAGNTITQTPDGQARAGDPEEYCVNGKWLSVRQASANVTATYVAERQ